MTDKQELFLEYLFSEDTKGKPREAARLAGYSDSTPLSQIMGSLKDKIYEKTKEFISSSAPQAAWTMISVMNDDEILGATQKMNAAKDFLDRAGFKPTDKVEVETKSPLFILPAKDDK